MAYDEEQTDGIPVKLPNGTVIKIETPQRAGKEDVDFTIFSFDDIGKALEGITEAIKGTIEKVKPKKTSVKFGIEVGIESGKLTAMIVKGTGKGNLEITMEWGQ